MAQGPFIGLLHDPHAADHGLAPPPRCTRRRGAALVEVGHAPRAIGGVSGIGGIGTQPDVAAHVLPSIDAMEQVLLNQTSNLMNLSKYVNSSGRCLIVGAKLVKQNLVKVCK